MPDLLVIKTLQRCEKRLNILRVIFREIIDSVI